MWNRQKIQTLPRGAGIGANIPDFSDDQPVLDFLGIAPTSLIGWGGEARVYGFGADRLVRILHPGADWSLAEKQSALFGEIFAASAHLSFDTTHVLDCRQILDRVVTIEQRFPGEPLSNILARAPDAARAPTIRAFLVAATQISAIDLSQNYFGDLVRKSPVRSDDYHDYLMARTRANMANAPAEFRNISAEKLVAALPVPLEKSLVHMDLFPGNVLIDTQQVGAIIDFGNAMIGDKRMELWSAVAYLDREISPDATDADRSVTLEWLTQRGLIEAYPAARRWLAAFWLFAHDDPNVLRWSKRVLLDEVIG